MSPHVQLFLITLLYLATVFVSNQAYLNAGTVNEYPSGFNILFAQLYEGILFRGLLLRGLKIKLSRIFSILFFSFYFGIWHLKNIESGKTFLEAKGQDVTVLFSHALANL